MAQDEVPPAAGQGLFTQLMAAGQGWVDREYLKVLANNARFRAANPWGHLLGDAMFGMQAVGGPAAPMARALPMTGARTPAGAYFHQSHLRRYQGLILSRPTVTKHAHSAGWTRRPWREDTTACTGRTRRQ